MAAKQRSDRRNPLLSLYRDRCTRDTVYIKLCFTAELNLLNMKFIRHRPCGLIQSTLAANSHCVPVVRATRSLAAPYSRIFNYREIFSLLLINSQQRASHDSRTLWYMSTEKAKENGRMSSNGSTSTSHNKDNAHISHLITLGLVFGGCCRYVLGHRRFHIYTFC